MLSYQRYLYPPFIASGTALSLWIYAALLGFFDDLKDLSRVNIPWTCQYWAQ